MGLSLDHNTQVETVVLLSKGEIDWRKVPAAFSLKDTDGAGLQ